MKNYNAEDVDSYLASAPEEARPHLEELRQLIKSTIPNVEEGISWGVPFYRFHGALAGIAPYKNHVSFGLVFVLQSEERKVLEEDGYITGKKTVQIKFDQKVPTSAIQQILKTQAKMNEANRAVK